jgi:energy-coupling factor transport system permease protein
MNNITIGQYIPGDSWLHKLDPRVKLLSLVILLWAHLSFRYHLI